MRPSPEMPVGTEKALGLTRPGLQSEKMTREVDDLQHRPRFLLRDGKIIVRTTTTPEGATTRAQQDITLSAARPH